MRASGVSGSTFYLEMEFFAEDLVRIRRTKNPTERRFGGGLITKRGASINLELRLDADDLYRWYGAPTELTENVKKVFPIDGRPFGRPFVLTQDYVADGLWALKEPNET